MAQLDGWSYRVPVAVVNSGPAASVDVQIPIPEDFDHFWETVDTSGDEIRLCSADGITVLTYQIGTGVAWSKANKTGILEIDGLTADATAASTILVWLYYGNSGAAAAAGSFTASTPVDGYIHLGRPGAFVQGVRPVEQGLTQPPRRMQKTSTERIRVWLEMRGMLESRNRKAAGSHLWEEVWQVVSLVNNDAGSGQSTMIEQDGTRFVEIPEGPQRGFYIGLVIKAGTTANNYTITPTIDTYAPEVVVSGSALIAGEWRTINPRAFLAVLDVAVPA